MVRLLQGLYEHPYGWSFEAIQSELDISERTLLRYVAACRDAVVDLDGNPLIETIRRGDRRLLRLTEEGRADDATVYHVLFLYFALSVFSFLDGTVIRDGVEDLWERFAERLPGAERRRMAEFAKKFYVVPFGTKDYRDHDDTIDVLLQCLIDQRRVRIDYAALMGDGKEHDFEIYTLAMYRGGLYLIGRSHRGKRIVKLAVERIRSAKKLSERFEYPRNYSPEKHCEGVFGIIEGDETKVEILIHDLETAAYLRARQIHPTQQFRERRDGKTVLAMTVRGTDELRYWLLGLGEHVEVLRPKSLRNAIADSLVRAHANYA